ncbi:MAG TPA: CRTAC1 family protein [Pirellulaceae bacterium]|nr:CRTAC1 family protein [Pirellulaceae bacterium]
MMNNGTEAFLFAMAVMIAVVQLGCKGNSSLPGESTSSPAEEQAHSPVRTRSRLSVNRSSPIRADAPDAADSHLYFVDVHQSLGVDFVYDRGARGKLLMVESTGGGAGWTDFDRDGNWDLLLVQGGFADGPRSNNPPNGLWRNLADEGFSQVEGSAHIVDRGYGQGVAIGDFDNDGFDDVYISNVGSNALYQNQGDGTFLEVTAAAGVDTSQWSTSAAWGDLNADGNLDLFVCNYLIYDPENPLNCPHADGTLGICHPGDLDAAQNVCFQNLGDGRYREVSSEWNLVGRKKASKSLGTAILDLTGDGYSDVLVANDGTANFFFVNDGHGVFQERGLELGCAMSGEGSYQASMGIAVGDFDQNHFFDIYMTHFTEESNTLYSNLGAAGFHDATRTLGLHRPTLLMLGFGTVMADFDRNGSLELFITNGHVDDYLAADGFYAMPPQLFEFSNDRWHDVSSRAGHFFETHQVGRAVASCDFDNDGDLDLAVVHQGSPAALLRNDSSENDWLKIQLIGLQNNRSAIGTTVRLRCGELDQVQQVVGGSSYCATHAPLLIFGLEKASGSCSLEIRWPDGFVQQVVDVATNQHITLREAAH